MQIEILSYSPAIVAPGHNGFGKSRRGVAFT